VKKQDSKSNKQFELQNIFEFLDFIFNVDDINNFIFFYMHAKTLPHSPFIWCVTYVLHVVGNLHTASNNSLVTGE
jgi:hypothetical protein